MRRTLLACLLVVSMTTLSRAAENWPEFRGPTADGHTDAKGLPVEWSEKNNVAWKTAIHGKAWSSPVIWGKQIWLTTAPEDGKQLYAVCVDRDSGKIVHDIKVFDVEKPAFCHAFNSHASCTPIVEDGHLYVHFGSAGTACLDTASGKVLWERRDLECDHWRGPGSSPILFKDSLILTFDGYDRQYLAALNKKDGKTIWKKDRNLNYGTDNGDLKKAYSTPRVIEVGGKPQLISPAAVWTTALDPETGDEIWKVNHGGMNVSARPLMGNGLLYLISGHTGRLLAVKPDGKGDITKTNVEWMYNKSVPTRPSLILLNDLMFFVSDDGVAGCVEAKTGKEVKKLRLEGKYSASPLCADGKLYFFSQEGPAFVVEATREMKQVAKNELEYGFMASPGVSGKAMYLRTTKHLYRIEK